MTQLASRTVVAAEVLLFRQFVCLKFLQNCTDVEIDAKNVEQFVPEQGLTIQSLYERSPISIGPTDMFSLRTSSTGEERRYS